MQKKWVVAEKFSDDVISQLLYNRELRDKNAVANFFNPPTPEVISSQYSTYLSKIDPDEVIKSLTLVKSAIRDQRPIVIHGDYDVDGLCATAILYQTLKSLGAKVTPFIPNRFTHGYGLSFDSLKAIQEDHSKPLLITLDCGITAADEVQYALREGFDVVIGDHHAPGEDWPNASAIVWTDELSGAGIAYLLASRLANKFKVQSLKFKFLDLVALATVADVQPLTGINRALVKYGLEELNQTRNVGLRELIKVAGLEGKKIGTYEVGWMLGPRLNASGRLQNASDSLNLLITEDPVEAQSLVFKLNKINYERQQITRRSVEQARSQHQARGDYQNQKLILLSHEEWHEGVIGLIAGKIKEEFYRPTLIISRGEKTSKGSARSIRGFNIVEAIRECQEFLLDAGGHEMAAGFTIETEKIAVFRDKLQALAINQLTSAQLTPTLNIDAQVELSDLTWNLAGSLKKFEPFGVGNPRPVFLTKRAQITSSRTVGSGDKHLKLQLPGFSAIGFGFGYIASQLKPGAFIDLVYSLEENVWNGRRSLQLKLKDLQPSSELGVGDKLPHRG